MKEFDEDTFEELDGILELAAGNMLSRACALKDAGSFYEEFSTTLRSYAILRLHIDADSDEFHGDLNTSAYARRHYLKRCARDKYWDEFGGTSRSEPFFDVLAAGNFELASELARLSLPDWRPGDEYEDDFAYARFIQLYLLDPQDPALDGLLKRFETALEGAESARLDLCRALRAGDKDVLQTAFDDLLVARAQELETAAARIEEDVVASLESSVFVEGLGLLRLCERAGHAITTNHPFCPAIARVTPPPPPPDTLPPV